MENSVYMERSISTIAIEFTSPRVVSVVTKTVPAAECDEVAHLETVYSAVSAGTELLVYHGDMPSDIPLDKTISSHNRPFQYPCQYGYAVAAVVTRDDTGTFASGTRVFAFREHTAHFLESPNALHIIPNDVSTLDAVFLPNVETALSLATDAAVLPGEAICVVGQGIVGLLLVSALRILHPYSTVVTVDKNAARRELSTNCARAHSALDPDASDFGARIAEILPNGADASIDVSGSGAGLQTAIDATGDHGRVVIGSWFGSKQVILPHLGGRFHRSHISLVASQVSEIPPSLRGRWTKSRRLGLAWRLLGEIKPSKTYPVHIASLSEAPTIYQEIAQGKYLQVIFKYSNGDASQA